MRDRFPQLLKKERRQQAWTQQELAEKLKTTRVTINRWESGKNTPSLYWRGKICELFRKQMEELFPETLFPIDTVDLTASPAFLCKAGEDILLNNEISSNIQSQSSRWVPESMTQPLSTETSHLEMHEKHLELQKKLIECIIDVANKMIIDVLDPQCDVKTRTCAIEEILLNHKYTYEANDQDILLPTIDDVRKALDIAKQTVRHEENGKESHDIAKQTIRHEENGKESHDIATEYQEYRHTLVAPLGGQPQIVTFVLDLLLQRGIPISEVIVVHPNASSPRLQRSLVRLNAEFASGYYEQGQRSIHFHSHVLQLDGEPIDDISDDPHADGTLETLHKLIGLLKRHGHHIHLCVAGGQRLISLLAISVAALNFDRHDHIWHIYTPEVVQEQAKDGRLMHVPPEVGVKLIRGQFIALGAYIYNESFHMAQQEQRAQMDANERARCEQVIKESTPSQRKVLYAFAQGLRPQQVAAQLNVELVTVHSHKTVLLRLCRNAWNISNDEHLDYHFLHTKFASYFESSASDK